MVHLSLLLKGGRAGETNTAVPGERPRKGPARENLGDARGRAGGEDGEAPGHSPTVASPHATDFIPISFLKHLGCDSSQ